MPSLQKTGDRSCHGVVCSRVTALDYCFLTNLQTKQVKASEKEILLPPRGVELATLASSRHQTHDTLRPEDGSSRMTILRQWCHGRGHGCDLAMASSVAARQLSMNSETINRLPLVKPLQVHCRWFTVLSSRWPPSCSCLLVGDGCAAYWTPECCDATFVSCFVLEDLIAREVLRFGVANRFFLQVLLLQAEISKF